MKRLLEVCVDDAHGIRAAVAGGADRIELCASLAVGGLTPSAGLIAQAAAAPIPSYGMVRPRGGDFIFDADEMDQMKRDIDSIRAGGLAGVVLGVSRPNLTLDEKALRALADHAEGLGKTLHKAIDLVPDKREGVEIAAALGFDRVLSSGGALKAPDGMDALAEMWEAAAGRLSIMPGGGVTAEAVGAMLAQVPFTELHSSCSVPTEPDKTLVAYEFAFPVMNRTDKDEVAKLAAAIAA